MEWTIPAITFPAEAGPHLPISTVSKQSAQDRYVTKITAITSSDRHASPVGYSYVPRWFTRPETVTHPSTNRARCWLTSLLRPTSLIITPRRQAYHKDLIDFKTNSIKD